MARGLQLVITHTILSWYVDQSMRVRWNYTLSLPFQVSNRVRQGGVRSLSHSFHNVHWWLTFWLATIGCWLSLGFRCSLLRRWSSLISAFSCCPSDHASILWNVGLEHGLRFNAAKTQLIHFDCAKLSLHSDHFVLCGSSLPFADCVLHLGHTLRYDLSDSDDINGKTHDMIRKANCRLNTFSAMSWPSLSSSSLTFSVCMAQLYGILK